MTELTQFAMVEFNAFKMSMDEMGVSFEPKTSREKAMVQFAAAIAGDGAKYTFTSLGGVDNIQRIRVLGEAGQPMDKQTLHFEFVTKLPVHILEQKKREAERDERRKALIARANELKNDPKKLEKFVRDVTDAIVRKAALALLLMSTKVVSKPEVKKAQKRQRVEPKDPYTAALRQDRKNRIEASKVAADKYHKEHDKNKAARKEAAAQ